MRAMRCFALLYKREWVWGEDQGIFDSDTVVDSIELLEQTTILSHYLEV